MDWGKPKPPKNFDPGTFSNSKAGAYLAELLSKEDKKTQRNISHLLHKFFVGVSYIEAIDDDRVRASIFQLWRTDHVSKVEAYDYSPLIKSLTINLMKARKLI